MHRPDITIEQADFDAEPGIRAVRQRVFMEEQQVPEELEWDGRDADAIHVVARHSNGEVVATARLLEDRQQGHIGRMAVLPGWRRQGIGSALLQSLLELARARGLHAVILNAQTKALDFYLRHGFEPEGEEFMDAGIPHRRMQRILEADNRNQEPDLDAER